jgi:hypothetical protein
VPTGIGGGVYANGGGSVAITGGQFTYNSAGNGGGGIFMSGLQSITVSGSKISGNITAPAGNHGGGGMCAALSSTGTTLSISGCQITGNTAGYGGGLVVADADSSPVSKVTITDVVISGNSAIGGDGGGMRIGSSFAVGGNVSITGCTIKDNNGGSFGGGIFGESFSGLAISSSVIEGNQVLGSTSDGGGAFLDSNAPVTITSTTFLDNIAGFEGGGLLSQNAVSVKLASCIVTGNAASDGGGVYAQGTNGLGSVTITGGDFLDNRAGGIGGGPLAGHAGGGIALTGLDGVSITGSIVEGNSAGFSGGGIYFGDNTTETVTDVTIYNNFGEDGGGIFVAHGAGTASILGSSITGNKANLGGGVCNMIGASLTLQEARVTGNTAASSPNIYGAYTPFT